jgi:uncharacterized protein (DUF58 family)
MEAPPRTDDLLDPRHVARLGNLELIARTIVEGFLRGVHRSVHRGSSVEFAEHRPYVPGDAIDRLDWRAFGKTDRLYLREFEDETNLRATFIIDASASMGFGSRGISKFRYASCLLAAFGYILHKQLDAIGLMTFDELPRQWFPPRASLAHLEGLLRSLEAVRPEGRTALSAVLHQAAEAARRRGLVMLFSDLLDEPREILRALARLRAGGSEVAVFHIVDPAEAEFPFQRWTLFRDAEDRGRRLRLNARWVRDTYLRNFRQHVDELRRGCHAARIDYQLVDVSGPFESALRGFLTARRRHGPG